MSALPSSMTEAELATMITEGRDVLAGVKAQLKALENEYSKRFADAGVRVLESEGKDVGTATFERDGMKMKIEVAKKVKWDSNKLQKIAGSMAWSQAERLFDITFSVKESTYKALVDEQLISDLNNARTTEISEPQVKFLGRVE